jgi:uncharacterized protein YPO0396
MRKIETEYDLKMRKQELEQRIEKLESELLEGWNEQLSRQINVLNHHLRVCEERLNGEWYRDEYTDNIEEIPFKK